MLVLVSVCETLIASDTRSQGAILDKLLCPGTLSLQRRFNTLD